MYFLTPLPALFILLIIQALAPSTSNQQVFSGRQPSVSVDLQGTVRMVYGSQDSIFCVTSTDQGQTFSKPSLVGIVMEMHLGMTRGPRLASSATYSMVTAIDKKGTIHSFLLDHRQPRWEPQSGVNDVAGSAVEGLMDLTADQNDRFFAVWLDIRQDHKNNIYTASWKPQSGNWCTNTLVYKSPGGNVCECCRPSIFSGNKRLVISFRNSLGGSRDIYYTTSRDGGQHFDAVRKAGQGTWQLNACPMDGGDVAIDKQGNVVAVWRRGNELFFFKEGQEEKPFGTGRTPVVAWKGANPVVVWQENNQIKSKLLSGQTNTKQVGTGAFPVLVALAGKKLFCAWEDNQKIHFGRL